ncbi:MAG: 2-hydroxyacyl-CoA dehydratase, partial [Clostridiales bacterium]|nr:2-hydroxyacyl-CoA dehydratase [Clostridiales bacterium]
MADNENGLITSVSSSESAEGQYEINHMPFTDEMRREYTILVPNMLEIHFRMLIKVLKQAGYTVELLTNTGPGVVTEGLKYVHNDACYPALLVIGQMIDALNSGKYDLSKTAVMITQTGGGCRASNYIHMLRKALAKAGYGYIPVLSMNLSGLEKESKFKWSIPT